MGTVPIFLTVGTRTVYIDLDTKEIILVHRYSYFLFYGRLNYNKVKLDVKYDYLRKLESVKSNMNFVIANDFANPFLISVYCI